MRDLDLEGCIQTQFDCIAVLVKIFGVLIYLFSSHSLSHLEVFFHSDKAEGLLLCKREGGWQIKFLKIDLLRNWFLQSEEDHQLGGSKHNLAEVFSP